MRPIRCQVQEIWALEVTGQGSQKKHMVVDTCQELEEMASLEPCWLNGSMVIILSNDLRQMGCVPKNPFFCNTMSILWDNCYSCYSLKLIYSVSGWIWYFSRPPGTLATDTQWSKICLRLSGTLATHSEWYTVCLGEIATSLGRLVLLLLIQNVLQCVPVKSPTL